VLEDIPQAIRACRVSVKTGGQFRWLQTTASSAHRLAALWQFTRRLSAILQLALRWQIDIRHPPSRGAKKNGLWGLWWEAVRVKRDGDVLSQNHLPGDPQHRLSLTVCFWKPGLS